MKSKKIMSLALAGALVVGSVAAPAPKKADAAKKYSAYLCFASLKYHGTRSNHDDTANFASYVKDGNTKKKVAKTSFKNASFKKGKFTFTVSVSGKGLKKFASDKGWNTIYVDTSLPGTQKKKLSVTKAVLKIDGKTVKTIKKPVLTPDPGSSAKFSQVMIINGWNGYAEKKFKHTSLKKMPKKSMSVTITGKLK